jgi:hypothetical protein
MNALTRPRVAGWSPANGPAVSHTTVRAIQQPGPAFSIPMQAKNQLAMTGHTGALPPSFGIPSRDDQGGHEGHQHRLQQHC